MADLFAENPERSARLARITAGAGLALAALVTYLAKTLEYKTAVVTFADGSPDIVHSIPLVRGDGIGDWLFALSPVLVSLAFICAVEVSLRRNSRAAANTAVGLAAVAVAGTFALMFGRGVIYSVPWAMALSGSVVLALQALDERRSQSG